MDDPTLLSWIERGQNIAALFVAIGVAAEFALGFMAGPARRRVDQAQEAEMLRLTNKSAVLEKEAAQLGKDAEQLRNENLKLEASVAWRRLSNEQQEALKAAMSPFVGMMAAVQYNVGDSEAGAFAVDISKPLKDARWDIPPEPAEIIKDARAAIGVPLPPWPKTGVVVRTADDKRSDEAGSVFVKELSKFGFDCVQIKREHISLSYLNILVLHRPDGPQGQFKLKTGADKNDKHTSAQTQ